MRWLDPAECRGRCTGVAGVRSELHRGCRKVAVGLSKRIGHQPDRRAQLIFYQALGVLQFGKCGRVVEASKVGDGELRRIYFGASLNGGVTAVLYCLEDRYEE